MRILSFRYIKDYDMPHEFSQFQYRLPKHKSNKQNENLHK